MKDTGGGGGKCGDKGGAASAVTRTTGDGVGESVVVVAVAAITFVAVAASNVNDEEVPRRDPTRTEGDAGSSDANHSVGAAGSSADESRGSAQTPTTSPAWRRNGDAPDGVRLFRFEAVPNTSDSDASSSDRELRAGTSCPADPTDIRCSNTSRATKPLGDDVDDDEDDEDGDVEASSAAETVVLEDPRAAARSTSVGRQTWTRTEEDELEEGEVEEDEDGDEDEDEDSHQLVSGTWFMRTTEEAADGSWSCGRVGSTAFAATTAGAWIGAARPMRVQARVFESTRNRATWPLSRGASVGDEEAVSECGSGPTSATDRAPIATSRTAEAIVRPATSNGRKDARRSVRWGREVAGACTGCSVSLSTHASATRTRSSRARVDGPRDRSATPSSTGAAAVDAVDVDGRTHRERHQRTESETTSWA